MIYYLIVLRDYEDLGQGRERTMELPHFIQRAQSQMNASSSVSQAAAYCGTKAKLPPPAVERKNQLGKDTYSTSVL